MADARKGDLVQINQIVLEPGQRPESLPKSTKAVPFECWIKGFLLDEEASLGDEVRIKTFIGRQMSGTLAAINPVYDHDFGRPRMELLAIGGELLKQLGRG